MRKNYDGSWSANLASTAAFAVTDPKLLTVDFAEIERKQKERRAFLDKNNPSPEQRVPAQQELNKLRGQLFSLQQAVESTETYVNNIAGTVELLEQRLEKALKEKKRYAEAGNLRAERGAERAVEQLESELDDAKRELTFAKQRSVNATRALKNFDGYERIAELKAQIEKPVVTK